ncbi:MAG TPA: MFS transporter [Candidatus Sericytochromatia bacterium]
MFQSGEIALELISWKFWLVQVPVDSTINTAEKAALAFSGPKFFVALVAGVVMAFAFQFVLTNLGVALGISMAGGSSSPSDSHDSHKESDSLGGTIRKIGFALGLGTLISVTVALFFASLFAVKLSLITNAGLGAIVGLVIWAAYFLLLVYFSSSTVGSVVGSVINTAGAGISAIAGTAAAAIGGTAASRQMVATAEAAAAAVGREFNSAIDPVSIRENVEEYIEALRPPELNIKAIRQEFENLLNDPNLKELAGSDGLSNINRQTFVDLISSRSDLSKRDVNRLADQLEGAWKNTVGQVQPQKDSMAELVNYLKSAAPTQLLGDQLGQRVDQLIQELGKGRQSQTDQSKAQPQATGPVAQAMTLGVNSLIGMVMGRTDLSDFDVEKVINQLQKLRGVATDQVGKIADKVGVDTPTLPFSTVRADVENYLLNTYSWQMNPQTVAKDFRDVLYDAEADPEAVVRELEQLNRSDFATLLQQRGVFTQAKIREISNTLEAIRQEVLLEARAAAERGHAVGLLEQVENYILTTPKADLTPEKIQLNFKPILEDTDADYEHLSTRLSQFDNESLAGILKQRTDLTPAEVELTLNELGSARDRVLRESQELQEAAKARIEAQWLKVKSFLRDTGKQELNPDGIERDLKTLLDDPQAGISALRARSAFFDRDTLVQILNQREDLNEEQINQTLDKIEGAWTRVTHTPQQIAGKAKEQYDDVTSALADYLRSTGKEELNPEGIQRDLTTLLDNPQAGVYRLRKRLSQVDRDTLVKLLSQRQDLSEQQVNQIIDQVQSTLRSILKAPRRFASRTGRQVQDFQSTIADYLRSTGKDELNPEGIQRDMQLLLHDPRAGVSSLSDRLSHFDRSTITALLSQRGDISEGEVNRIAEQIMGVREQVMGQLQNLQQSIQYSIDRVFAKIRNYLNSLDRPELNYDGIRTDFRKLFDDPQAGFDALRARLSQFDRDTLVAVMSSREDISEADANRLIDQIERTRNSVLQRAERLQLEAQRRVDEVKHQAQRQAEETRKAAATAAWWLFGTAVVSGIFSALAGYIGVSTSV